MLLIVPVCAVVENNRFIGVAVVLDCARRRESPFDKGCPAYQGDIVKVDDLCSVSCCPSTLDPPS